MPAASAADANPNSDTHRTASIHLASFRFCCDLITAILKGLRDELNFGLAIAIPMPNKMQPSHEQPESSKKRGFIGTIGKTFFVRFYCR
jgi:hypothetical protein